MKTGVFTPCKGRQQNYFKENSTDIFRKIDVCKLHTFINDKKVFYSKGKRAF